MNKLDAATDFICKTTDSAATWAVALNDVPKAVLVDPVTPTIVYGAMNGSGAQRSSDSGGTWSAITTGLVATVLYTIVINPSSETVLYAGGLPGVYRTTDSGGSWTTLEPLTFTSAVFCLASSSA